LSRGLRVREFQIWWLKFLSDNGPVLGVHSIFGSNFGMNWMNS
jgi:hypothetical protein